MQLSLGIYSVAVILIAIMLSIAGIVLGIGYAADDRRLKEFGRSEIYQCIINGIIVSTLIVAFSGGGFFTLLINNIYGNAALGASCQQSMSGNYAICFAYNYLVGVQPVTISGVAYPTLIDTSVGLLAPISVLYTGLSLLSSIKLSIGVVGIGFSNVFTPVLTALDYIIELLTASIIGIEVQGILLQFIAAVAIPILLPLGIVLRTAYVTRRLGGAIMAIAIGLFAVFPMTYVLNATLASTYINGLNSSTVTTLIATETSANSNLLNKATQLGSTGSNSTGTFGYFTNAINGIVQSFDGFINELIDIVALIVIEVFFLPVFSIILTVISIRELARVLGSEISFGRFYIF